MVMAYVYKVTNKITGQFYFGSRTNNVAKGRTPEEDLWKYYFTSSKIVKALIEEYGIDSFDIEILLKDEQYETCFWEEQKLIFESKDNPKRLNKAYVNPVTGKHVLTTFNETLEQKNSRAQKISASKKGKFNSNGHYGLRRTVETKEKMKVAQNARGYTHSEEVKEKMRSHERTPEHSAKLSDSLKGKPWSEARRAAHENRKGK